MRARRGDQGGASVELVLVTPLVMLLIAVAIQFALYYHASNIATAAAQDGVRAAQVEHGSGADGAARARVVADRAGSVLEGVSIDASRGERRVRVEVSGSVVSFVPGLHLTLTRSAEGSVEQFLPPDQR
ncbi:MAG: TadE/TadG family type IV pilus assembly protein [Acidimicrobiia bacterium]